MNRDLLKIIYVGVLILSLTGCATTKQHSNVKVEELQNRITFLEKQLSQKDEEIQFLAGELEIMERKRTGDEKSSKREPDIKGTKPQSEIGTTKQVQTALRNAGFYKGRIDGQIGTSTRKAIKEFQKANGLTVDGKIGKETWSKLRKHLR